VSIDFGYVHFSVDDVEILDINAQTGHRIAGEFNAAVDIIGIKAIGSGFRAIKLQATSYKQ
jgi:hypothetical protein